MGAAAAGCARGQTFLLKTTLMLISNNRLISSYIVQNCSWSRCVALLGRQASAGEAAKIQSWREAGREGKKRDLHTTCICLSLVFPPEETWSRD